MENIPAVSMPGIGQFIQLRMLQVRDSPACRFLKALAAMSIKEIDISISIAIMN